jgi:hypothetical protein
LREGKENYGVVVLDRERGLEMLGDGDGRDPDGDNG